MNVEEIGDATIASVKGVEEQIKDSERRLAEERGTNERKDNELPQWLRSMPRSRRTT